MKTLHYSRPAIDTMKIHLGFAETVGTLDIPLVLTGFTIGIPGVTANSVKASADATISNTTANDLATIDHASKANYTWLTVTLAGAETGKLPTAKRRKIHRVRIKDNTGNYTLFQLSGLET